jgi:hypothetical protein
VKATLPNLDPEVFISHDHADESCVNHKADAISSDAPRLDEIDL